MIALRSLLLVLVLTAPSVAMAEHHEGAADHEADAHEVAEAAEGKGESYAHEVAEGAEESAHAERDGEHPGHGELTFKGVISNTEFIGFLVNFTALIVLFWFIIRKKGNPALAEKRKEVERELAEAQRLRAEAEKRHMGTQARLERLDEEMVELRAEMIKAGEAERDRIVAAAEEKAARIRKDTSFLIEQQIKQLRQDLTREASSAAVAAAQELLTQTTTDQDQDRLAEAYLDRLDEVIEETRL
jgi:F-type H+-transporting ATPase subunit b